MENQFVPYLIDTETAYYQQGPYLGEDSSFLIRMKYVFYLMIQ